jgi:hypothetical protein
MTLSITIKLMLSIAFYYFYAECHTLNFVMLSVIR